MIGATLRVVVLLALAAGCLGAHAQDGLRLPSRTAGTGLNPGLAPGWLSLERDRLHFSPRYAPGNWRDAIGFAPSHRMQWAYDLGERTSLGLSLVSGRDYGAAPIFGRDARHVGLFGRYAFDDDWSLAAEASSREPGAVLRLHDFRIGLRRQF